MLAGAQLRAGGHERAERVGVEVGVVRQPFGGLGQQVPAGCRARGEGMGGAAFGSVVVAAPGQAARIAASTAPGGTVPGTHTVIRSCRPVHVYCHTTCGDPYSSRRLRDGVSTPCRFAHSAAAACSSTSGGGAMVTIRAPAA
ncbi:hypothetical protein GCM10027610_080560 [Dactylosporangium cerinum]